MISKYVLLAISMMANGTKHDAIESQESIKLFIKKTIKNELMNNIFRVFIGIILLILVIVSMAKFETSFFLFLDQYQNSISFKLMTFGLSVVIGLILLFLLFRSSPRHVFTKKNKPIQNKIEIDKLTTSFIEGFFESLDLKK